MKIAAIVAACLLSLAAPAQSPPPAIVGKIEAQMTAFLNVFSDVKCTEQVTQEKLKKTGKVEYEEQSTFDYLLIALNSGDDLSLNESRLEQVGAAHKKNVSLLVTNGFATMLLIFHPQYASAFEFVDDGSDVLAGKTVEKIRFRHIRGRATPMAFMLRGRVYPVELTGTAWVDPQTGIVQRIRAELQDRMDDIGIQALVTDVSYAEVKFRGASSAWLPSTAAIDVETSRQHWRNVHTFSHYQRFSVTTEESVKATP